MPGVAIVWPDRPFVEMGLSLLLMEWEVSTGLTPQTPQTPQTHLLCLILLIGVGDGYDVDGLLLGVDSEACAWTVWACGNEFDGPVAESVVFEDSVDVAFCLFEWDAGVAGEVGGELVVELSDGFTLGDGLFVGQAQSELFAEGDVAAREHGKAAGVGDTAEEGGIDPAGAMSGLVSVASSQMGAHKKGSRRPPDATPTRSLSRVGAW